MNKFEKLIEYIINDEDQKARELFHSIVVDKSRDIYESIMDEESMEEKVSGDQVGALAGQLQDEEAMGEGEGEEFDLDAAGDEGDVSGDLPAGDMGGDDFGGEPEGEDLEDKVMTIDAKLDELLAKFDEITGGDDDIDASDVGHDEMGDEGGEDLSAGPEEAGAGQNDDEMFAEGENPFAKGSGKSGASGKSGSAKSGTSGTSGSAKSGKSGKPFESRRSTSELMREYVDKIGDIYGGQGDASEGDAVGSTGKKTSVNTKSFPGPGADFGGNVVKRTGADNENPDGKPVPKANNEYTKGQGTIKSGNVNVPGGKAGAPKSTGHEYTKDAKGAEGQTTSGKVSVATKSVQVQNTGKK